MLLDSLLILMGIFATIVLTVLVAVLVPALGIFLLGALATVAVAPFAAIDWILRKIHGED